MNYFSNQHTNETVKGEDTGTYVGLRLSASSRQDLLSFCQTKKIELKAVGNAYERRMHTTVFYSYEKPQHTDLGNIHGKLLAIRAKAKGWKILPRVKNNPNEDEKQCLVLEIESTDLYDYHHQIHQQTGMEHAFNIYTPHITIDYEFNGQIPQDVPEFELLFQELYVKNLFY